MSDTLNNAIKILKRLVSFDSISGKPNREVVGYIENYLSNLGLDIRLSYDDVGERANVFCTIGPEVDGGVVFSGHTDVVPVDGQNWSTDPFVLTRINDRFYGRGSVDMKGFLACVMASVPTFQAAKLNKPIHLAFSYDEETGGFGMPVLLENMSQLSMQPGIVIVGEPTSMQLITGHKGAYEMRTEITGHAVHSCDPTKGVNAIFIASKLIEKIQEIGARLSAKPYPNSPYEPAYCTVNVGIIEGGTASNATAGWCNFNWEIRPMPGENGRSVVDEIIAYANSDLLPDMKAISQDSDIRIITNAAVPALDDTNAEKAAALVSHLTGLNSRDVVSFGTDAGYFSDAGLSTVVFGAGDINRAHKADEYIEVSEMIESLQFLEKVSQHLTSI